MTYNWQQKDWLDFKYDLSEIEDTLIIFMQRVWHVSGLLEGLSDKAQKEAVIETMVAEAIKTSQIEGEYISRKDVMSSIKNNLGLNSPADQIHDKKAEGAAELMVSVRNDFSEPLTEQALFSWHTMLMKGSRGVKVGEWRTHEEPMQVISGLIGKEKVHYEAPPSERVPDEMAKFITWFNQSAPGEPKEIKKPIIRSAIAHLWFETIHPFEDGNGRIGRAISEKALSQNLGRPVLLSLSRAIEAKRSDYYDALQAGQRSNEITDWIGYFSRTVLEAQIQAEEYIAFTLKTAKFFDRYRSELNDRQLRAIQRMLDEGPEGFEGGMSAKKYISITKTSKATATRDLQDLAEKGAFVPFGAGRSTKYNLNL